MPKKGGKKTNLKVEEKIVEETLENEVEPAPKSLSREEWLSKYPQPDEKKLQWFWAGVVGFAVLIGIIWLVSLKFQMAELAKRKSIEGELFTQTKNDWEAIFEEKQQKLSTANIKRALNDAVGVLVNRPPRTASTTTTTVEFASSTVDTTTTLK